MSYLTFYIGGKTKRPSNIYNYTIQIEIEKGKPNRTLGTNVINFIQ